MSTLITKNVCSAVSNLGNGAIFTGPELRKAFPKIAYATLYNRLTYLVKRGVLEKTNVWNGNNYISYRVVDTNKLPQAIDFSERISQARNPGKGLFPGVTQQTRSINLVSAVDTMADRLTELLHVAKEHPQATIANFTTAELLSEIQRRASTP